MYKEAGILSFTYTYIEDLKKKIAARHNFM